jgi:hypothetical protein
VHTHIHKKKKEKEQAFFSTSLYPESFLERKVYLSLTAVGNPVSKKLAYSLMSLLQEPGSQPAVHRKKAMEWGQACF